MTAANGLSKMREPVISEFDTKKNLFLKFRIPLLVRGKLNSNGGSEAVVTATARVAQI